MNHDNSNPKIIIGIDVSKNTLDIFFNGKSYRINNKPDDISNFISSSIDSNLLVLCVMESTGGYERLAAKLFHKFNIQVHIAHPTKVHAFAKVCGHFAKTDKLDAILLQKYGEFLSNNVKPKALPSQAQEKIIALRRTLRALELNLHAAQCRLQQMPDICLKYIKQEIKFYQKQIWIIEKDIELEINNNAELKDKLDLMVTMKGIGKKIAATLLAELPELGSISRKQIASLVGVVPRTYQSGIKSSSGHIFGGRFFARKALYMGALVAAHKDADAIAKYQKLITKGKPKKLALTAIMRDTIITLNSMLKFNKTYNLTS